MTRRGLAGAASVFALAGLGIASATPAQADFIYSIALSESVAHAGDTITATVTDAENSFCGGATGLGYTAVIHGFAAGTSTPELFVIPSGWTADSRIAGPAIDFVSPGEIIIFSLPTSASAGLYDLSFRCQSPELDLPGIEVVVPLEIIAATPTRGPTDEATVMPVPSTLSNTGTQQTSLAGTSALVALGVALTVTGIFAVTRRRARAVSRTLR
jgi:hypothetical protein